MKRIYYILTVIFAVMLSYSCSDSSSMLDKEDVGDLYERDVFSNPEYAMYFVNDIYYNLLGTGYEVTGGWSGAYLDCATDNGEARNLTSYAHRFNNGNWNANNVPMGGLWSKAYAEIRACNKFLENYDQIPTINGIATRDDLEYYRAQTLFLRAYFYAELAKYFGGVPIIDHVLTLDDPILKTAERATYDQLIEYIVNECDEAAEIFRVSEIKALADDPQNYGRATEGACMALKAKVLTIAASPLFNRPANYSQYDSGDPNLKHWRYPDYSKERWKIAADALLDVINLNRYSIYTSQAGTKTAYETYFATRYTPDETIFSTMKASSIDIYYNNLPFEFMNVNGKGSPMCYNLPTQELVEAYEMSNGMLPQQPNSGYRPLNPYADRDPRLDATIWHDGSVFCGIEFQTWRREVTSSKMRGKHYITGYSRTGYYLKKYMDVDLNPTEDVSLPNIYHIIRYADILLMYAEALNEYHDNPSATSEIAASIDQVRSRAGMPGLTETFTNRGWAMTQDNVRKLIQNERRVEFAFEEHRFWDIRRWMIGTSTQRGVNELDIVLKDDDKTKVYTVRPVEKRFYEEYMNLLPIPQSEINKNKNLVQNWGWIPAPVN